MYSDIITMCWSIKEVNKNLLDRKSITDYSVKYLRDACAKLASMLDEVDKERPGEIIEVVDKSGQKRRFSITEVARMLTDVKKIMELNLIDHIDEWARAEGRSS